MQAAPQNAMVLPRSSRLIVNAFKPLQVSNLLRATLELFHPFRLTIRSNAIEV
jgi:hypothetical protein